MLLFCWAYIAERAKSVTRRHHVANPVLVLAPAELFHPTTSLAQQSGRRRPVLAEGILKEDPHLLTVLLRERNRQHEEQGPAYFPPSFSRTP